MTPRIVASGCAAVLGFGLMLAPAEAPARGGGLAAPRGLSAPAGIGPLVAKPAMSGGAAVGIHPWHAKPYHHRRPFRHGALPVVWGAPYWYGADYSPLYPVPYDQPLDDLSAYPLAETGPYAAPHLGHRPSVDLQLADHEGSLRKRRRARDHGDALLNWATDGGPQPAPACDEPGPAALTAGAAGCKYSG